MLGLLNVPLPVRGFRSWRVSRVTVKATMLPDVLPAVWGAKTTPKGTLCPAGTVTGKSMPPSEYP